MRRLPAADQPRKSISGGEGYLDYRKLLDRDDIDAVLIATPDHWHSKIAIDAMASGKHVYVEKPMTHTVEQAIELRDAVARYGKVLEVGPQATGNDGVWLAHEAIHAGRIGKVTWRKAATTAMRACACSTNIRRSTPRPDPTRPAMILSTGICGWATSGDWRRKFPGIPNTSSDSANTGPTTAAWPRTCCITSWRRCCWPSPGRTANTRWRGNATGGQYIEKDGRDIPDTFLLTADYPSEYSIFLVSTLTNDTQLGDRIYGKHGTMDFDGTPVLRVNSEFADEFKAPMAG